MAAAPAVPAGMESIWARPQSMHDRAFHFCPGCNHGNVHKHIAEAIDEFGIRRKTIGVAGVGSCSRSEHFCSLDSRWLSSSSRSTPT